MGRFIKLTALVVLAGLLVYSCSQSPDQQQSQESPMAFGPSFAISDINSETLGDLDIPIPDGTGIFISGVGLVGQVTDQPGTINYNIPGDVKLALLYWVGHNATEGGDGQITLDGNPLAGALIGGPTLFFPGAWSTTYRADITSVINSGPGSIEVGGMDFTTGCPWYCQNLGVGLLVVYDDGTDPKEIGIKDGNDNAFISFLPPLDTTVPQTFNFTPADNDRVAKLHVMAGSVAQYGSEGGRPNVIEVVVGGNTIRFVDPLQGTMGDDFDAVTLDVDIPAGAGSMTVQALSETDPTSAFTGLEASMSWLVAAAVVPPGDEEEPPLACRVTGGGVDENGNWDGSVAKGAADTDKYTCGGQAGAPTALQPQPRGEWTHSNHKGPSGAFTFHAGTASAPEFTEIDWIECSDPGWCVQARKAPAKQIDFAGVGTFKNIKPNVPESIADHVIKGESLHWFEVNIDDLGEPGKAGKVDPPADQCDPLGYGRNGGTELADCDCPDFYRIKIYAGPTDASPVIYEISGYIRGGNFQIHPLTGNDLN